MTEAKDISREWEVYSCKACMKGCVISTPSGLSKPDCDHPHFIGWTKGVMLKTSKEAK